MSSLRLVLVGKTGAGKSSVGNTILGEKRFKAGFSFKAVTTECQKEEGEVDGRTVMVVDTPGIADSKVSGEDAKDRVAECFPMSAPGPHAFLLVIKLGRFTPEEEQAAGVIEEVFGEAALKHTMVLFTNGDQLEDPDDLQTLLKGSKEMRDLLDKLNWRYHIFNNKVDDRTQVIELLSKIDQMVGERGHYTSELFEVAIKKRKEKREEEELRNMWKKKPEMRILLFGNTTESNRTARKIFLEERCQYSGTDGCQKTNGEVLGRRVSVVETVGLSDMRRMKSEKASHEILLCISFTSPGPHAFVIVERSQEDIAEREDILKLIEGVFGDQALKYVMLLAIESSEKPVPDYEYSHSHHLEHHASKALPKHENLPTHIFEDSRNLKQITSLLQKIDKMVEENSGSHFTGDMYSEAEKAIREAKDKILEEQKLEISKSDKFGLNNICTNVEKQALIDNSLVNSNISVIVVLCGGLGVVLGGALGAALGSTGGTAVAGPGGTVVGGTSGAVIGVNKGAAAGAAIGAGIVGVLGAITGGVAGYISKQTEKNEKKQK